MAADALEPAIAALLAACGREAGTFTVEPLSAGGNNRVYIVQTKAERLAAKLYYHDPADQRDRLGAEYAFLEHAWKIGLRCVPCPYGRDATTHLALYEFVEGEKLATNEIDARRVMEAAHFLASLNAAASRQQAQSLPLASEACFSMTEHCRMINGRLARLDQINPNEDIDRKAADFVLQLVDYWARTKDRLLVGCTVLGLQAETPLPTAERCLSPSDFGFHNALRRPDGSLCFIDFEYAGWDDPAKAVGDFFSHPGVAVPRKYFDDFLTAAMTPFADPAAGAARARLLEPLFRLKWCCIILNEFLPDAARRRHFADPGADTHERKTRQLAKASSLFSTLQT